MKTKIRYLLLGVLLCLVLSHVFALIKCEVLTRQHYDEFKDAYQQNTMLDEMEFFKVMEYEACGVAKVYYVSKGYSLGSVLTFAYQDGKWEEVSWNVYWSTSGNADKSVYPYWWHAMRYAYLNRVGNS